MRVLTFNFHEPYLWLMAKTGYDFTVGLYRDPPLARDWHVHYRPIPRNMTLVEESQWRVDLARGRFDVVIAHNESNALDLLKYRAPKILVCHNRKTFLKTTITDRPDAVSVMDRVVARLAEHFRFVFISESKRADYGVSGDVILPGIDVDEFGGYTGEVAEILRVGNMMRGRDLMFDVDFQERACAGLPNRVVGMDPSIANAREAESFDDLLRLYRTRRCLLHVTRQEYEDGYNLAMLEAMACGMPVAALANATSPVTDGVDGFVSADADALNRRLGRLLEDAELARQMGARARETVAEKFPIAAFVDAWRRVIDESAQKAGRIAASTDSALAAGGYYRHERAEMAQFVPVTAMAVLDVGCGAGDFGRLLKRQGVPFVCGVERVAEASELARQGLDQIINADVEQLELPFVDGHFDCITFNDVLEHLVEPGEALRKVLRCLSPDGILLASFPNVRYYKVIAMLSDGWWTYDDEGIMDKTHLRFFTAKTMRTLLEEAGLEVLRMIPLSKVPSDQMPVQADGSLQLGCVTIRPRTERDMEDFAVFQYVAIAGKPGGDRLSRARALLDAGAYDAAFAAARDAFGVDEREQEVVLGRAIAGLGHYEQAAEIYRHLAESNPADLSVKGEYGAVLLELGRTAEAMPLLLEAAHADGAAAPIRGALARAHLAEGRADAALDLLQAALSEDMDHPELVAELIRAAEEAGRIADIVDVAERYADYYPGNADVVCACAETLLTLGRGEEARGRVEMLLLLEPGHPRACAVLRSLDAS